MRYTNETLAVEIKNIQVQLIKLDASLANLANTFLSKDVFELRMKAYDTEIAQINLELARVEKQTRRSNWRTHTLTATFTAGLVLLVTYVFNDVLGR